MPQFSMIPERKRILEKIPDYAVELTPTDRTITVTIGDDHVAHSSRALLVKETKHADVYYLPREDVELTILDATEHSTYCPFKGHASYWSLGEAKNVAWSYETPYPEVEGLKGFISFYSDRAEITAS